MWTIQQSNFLLVCFHIFSTDEGSSPQATMHHVFFLSKECSQHLSCISLRARHQHMRAFVPVYLVLHIRTGGGGRRCGLKSVPVLLRSSPVPVRFSVVRLFIPVHSAQAFRSVAEAPEGRALFHAQHATRAVRAVIRRQVILVQGNVPVDLVARGVGVAQSVARTGEHAVCRVEDVLLPKIQSGAEVRREAVVVQVVPVVHLVHLQPRMRAHGVDVAATQAVRGADVEHSLEERDALVGYGPCPGVLRDRNAQVGREGKIVVYRPVVAVVRAHKRLLFPLEMQVSLQRHRGILLVQAELRVQVRLFLEQMLQMHGSPHGRARRGKQQTQLVRGEPVRRRMRRRARGSVREGSAQTGQMFPTLDSFGVFKANAAAEHGASRGAQWGTANLNRWDREFESARQLLLQLDFTHVLCVD
eukprot:Colp12_sorted_trinity150504_noHs@14300